MANLGAVRSAYTRRYLNSGGNTSQLASEFPTIYFQNGMLGLQIKSLGGDFSQFETVVDRCRHAGHECQLVLRAG